MKFEDIRIYDRDFNLLMMLPGYLSVNWEIKFCGYGDGEIRMRKTDDIIDLLRKNKYLFVVQNGIQSIVTGYRIGDECTVFTRTLEWMLTKFAVDKFSASDIGILSGGKCSTDNLIEHVLKSWLHQDFCVEFRADVADKTDVSDFVLTEVSTVYDVVKSLIKAPDAGFSFYRDFSDGHFIFRTKKAAENENLIFSDNYNTSYDSQYNFDIQQEATGGIYYHKVTNMGKWNGATNSPEVSITPENYGKYYTVSEDGVFMGQQVYKGDVLLCKRRDGIFDVVSAAEPFAVKITPEDNGIFSWTAPLVSKDTAAAARELSDKKALNMVTCTTGLSYMEDFRLGDIAKVKFFAENMSYETKKLISEIHIWDEANDSGAVPTMKDISQEVDYVI